MSRHTPSQQSSIFNPQIVAATITAFATVAVAFISVVPSLLNNISRETPTPTIAGLFVTATLPSTIPIATSDANLPTLSLPSATPFEVFPTATIEIIETPIPIPTTPPLNLALMYDASSFTVLNQNATAASLEGIVFRSSIGQWDATGWGVGVYNNLPSGACLRVRDFNAAQQPSNCSQIYGSVDTQGSALFWLNVDQFEVVRNGIAITTCFTAAGTCSVYVP
jgi:hypothetical protein